MERKKSPKNKTGNSKLDIQFTKVFEHLRNGCEIHLRLSMLVANGMHWNLGAKVTR